MLVSVIEKGISFFLITLYTNILSPDDYGAIDLVNVYLTFSVIIFGAELMQAIARFLPEMRYETEKSRYVSTALVVVVAFKAFLGINLLFSDFISSFLMRKEGYKRLIILALPWIAFNGIFFTIQSQLC